MAITRKRMKSRGWPVLLVKLRRIDRVPESPEPVRTLFGVAWMSLAGSTKLKGICASLYDNGLVRPFGPGAPSITGVEIPGWGFPVTETRTKSLALSFVSCG